MFDLVGNYITRIGGLEVTGGMLSMNYGVAIQEPYGDLYVCDWANNRVQIFLHDYPFTRQFGNGVLQSPRDIQLTEDNILYCVKKTTYLYIFNFDLTQVEYAIQDSVCRHLAAPSVL